MVRKSKLLFLVFFMASGTVLAQEPGKPQTFTYKGHDAVLDELNMNNVFYLGLTMGVVQISSNMIIPLVSTVYFEYKYLFFNRNETINLSAYAKPQLAITQFFLVRAGAGLQLNFGAEADTRQMDGLGFSLGGGYEFKESTFDFREKGPVAMAYFRVDNVRVGYQFSFGDDVLLKHTLCGGVMLHF